MWSWKRTAQALLGIALCCLGATRAPAQTGADPDTGIDLVVLIDQSGSMWGHPRWHPDKNDAWGHRIGATQEIIQRLMEDVWKKPTVHRFSVIDFADTAKVAWSDQVLRYDPADAGALRRRIQSQLSERVKAKTGEDWINTNTPLALRLAGEELTKMGAGEPRTGRRRIVLVITDGRANLPPASLGTMERRLESEAQALRRRGIELWAIGLNDADDYWHQGDGIFWETHVTGPDHARLARTAAGKLPTVVGSMVNEWLGSNLSTSGGSAAPVISGKTGDHYLCPPYLGRLTFRVSFSTPHAEIRILDPDGIEMPRTAGGPLVEPGTYDHFTQDDPKPGVYRIEKRSDRAYNIDPEETAPHIERLVPVDPVDPAIEAPIVFQVKTFSGKPLALLPKWPIRVAVRLIAPSGQVQELPASAGPDGRFETRFKPNMPGVYQAALQGIVRLPDGTERDVFRGDPRAYPRRLEVSDRPALGLRLDSPRPEAGLRIPPWAKSARVEMSLVDAKGNRIEKPGALVKNTAGWLALQEIDPSAVPVGKPVPLTAANGSFMAEVPVRPDWRTASGLTREGRLYLKVIPQPGRASGESRLSSIQLPPKAQDRRVGGDPLTVGPIDLLLPRWLIGLIALAVLLAGALLVWSAFSLVVPGWLIRRQDAARGRNVTLKIFDVASDPAALSALSLPVGGGHRFTLDGKVSFPVGGVRVVAEKFRVTRLPGEAKARARLEYRFQGKRDTHTVDLTSGNFKGLKDLPAETGRTVVMLTDTK